MRDASKGIEFLLLDLHLNRIEPGQSLQVEEALASSAELASQSRALRDMLTLLDRYEVAEPSGDLVDQVMLRIDSEPHVIPFPKERAMAALRTGQEAATMAVLSLRELVAIAACITLFVGVFVPGYFKAQNVARRTLCRNNLQQVYAGLVSYSNQNNAYLPFTGFVPNASWMSTRAPNVRRVSATGPLFAVLRGGYVPNSRVFICPSAPNSRPMVADNYAEFTDFAEPANISYSFQHVNRPHGRRLDTMEHEMVLAGDRNPYLDGQAVHQLSPYDERGANSITHEEGAGQNVIYVNGTDGWFTQPTIGVNQDNIYQAGQLQRYQGTEKPASETDTFLVN
jgi:hypothetical protein